MRPAAWGLAALCLAAAAVAGCATDAPHEDRSATARALKKLPRKNAEERVVVAVQEVGSSVQELPARGATAMFKTALVKSGQFRVVERTSLQRGVLPEKQMNAAGQTTGRTEQQPLRGVEYYFQAEITEINAGAANASTGVNIAGLQLGGASNRDTIGLDVSIIDAATGDIVDAVNVRRKLGGSATSVSGVAALVGTVMAEKGKATSVYTPDVTHTSTRKSSLDAAMRECLEEATRLLALRFESAQVVGSGAPR